MPHTRTIYLWPTPNPTPSPTPVLGLDPARPPLAHRLDLNPLLTPDPLSPYLFSPSLPPAVIPTGHLLDDDSAVSFRTWTPAGWSRLNDLCDHVSPRLSAAGRTLLLRPRATDVLADPTACLSFLRARAAQPFDLLLDPCAMLTPSMLPLAEDHLSRALESLAEHPRTRALLLTNLAPPSAGPTPSPVHLGLLSADLLARLLRDLVPPSLPLVLADAALPEQLAALGLPAPHTPHTPPAPR